MAKSSSDEEKQVLVKQKELITPNADSNSMSYTLESSIPCHEWKNGQFTTKELIDQMGFGKAQVIACLILSLSYIGGFSAVQLQPFLSARLYVEMQLSPYSEALLGLVSLGGLLFAGIPMGIVSDKIGRKKTIILTCFLMTFWNGLACLSINFTWIVICRLLVSMSRGTVNTGNVYFREYLPSDKLWIGPVLGQHISGTILGDLFAIIMAYFILTDKSISWKYFVILMSFPMVLCILLAFCFLEETPEHLMSKGRDQEAVNVLVKIAKLNNKTLPKAFKLIPNGNVSNEENTLCDSNSSEKSYWSLFFSVITTWQFVKVFVLIILIGSAGKLVNEALNFILADLLFLQGQIGDYYTGTHLKSYYISKSDYLKLFMAQLTSVITIFVSVPVMKSGVSLKLQSLVCFLLCVTWVSVLYFCPDVYIVLLILSVVRIAMQLINMTSVLSLLQLEVPGRVRGLIIGLGQTLRNSFLPLYAFFTQALSKESQHYVTSLTLFFMVMGLVAALFIPKDVNEGIVKESKDSKPESNSNSG